ncbi:MAG: tetratricopeptide repeat protein [Pseudomonadota bacterium]
MRHSAIGAAMLAVVVAAGVSFSPSGAVAAQGGVLAGCADPELPATDTLTLCQRALRDTDLTPQQRAAVLVNLGVAQAAIGRHVDAEQSFGLAIGTDDTLVQAFGNRARSRLALGRYADALEDFDEAIARAPGDAQLWLGRGGALLRGGSARAAVSDLSRAIRIDPSLDAAWFNRGLGYLLVGETEAADADFSTVIKRDDRDAGAYLNRGRARAVHAPARAGSDFDRAVALAPDWGRVFVARGQFRDDRGDAEGADQDFLRAYELGERDVWLLDRIKQIGG